MHIMLPQRKFGGELGGFDKKNKVFFCGSP